MTGIAARAAAEAAIAFATELLGGNQLDHLRVEEISRSSDERSWLVTLGWDDQAVRLVGGQSLVSPFASSTPTLEKLPRVYRIFDVDAETAQVRSMKMQTTS
jgi:hypothetical protein